MTQPTYAAFPKQTAMVGKRVMVRLAYLPPQYPGTIIRDDQDDPYRTIIKLDDGHVVLGTECQYMILAEPKEAEPVKPPLPLETKEGFDRVITFFCQTEFNKTRAQCEKIAWEEFAGSKRLPAERETAARIANAIHELEYPL